MKAPRQHSGGHESAFANGSRTRDSSRPRTPRLRTSRRAAPARPLAARPYSSPLRSLRAMKNVKVHGYYPAGTLPFLLRRHGIGLVLAPSVVPEAFCLTISEAWAAGAAVAAFDVGAQGERIRRQGGGWVAPLESG